MRGTSKWALLAALLLAGAPANAGLRAVYHGESDPKQLEVEVGDNGDFRIGEPGADRYGLELGGTYYLVTTAAGGESEVMKIEDVAAVLGERVGPIFSSLFSAAAEVAPRQAPRISEEGSRRVAGHEGTVTRVSLGNPAQPDVQVFVLSNDAALEPLGRAITRYLESMMLMAAPMMGEMAADMMAEMRAVFSRGTPLESEGRFRLQDVKQAEIPATRLALPAEPLDRAAILSRLVTGNPAGAGPD